MSHWDNNYVYPRWPICFMWENNGAPARRAYVTSTNALLPLAATPNKASIKGRVGFNCNIRKMSVTIDYFFVKNSEIKTHGRRLTYNERWKKTPMCCRVWASTVQATHKPQNIHSAHDIFFFSPPFKENRIYHAMHTLHQSSDACVFTYISNPVVAANWQAVISPGNKPGEYCFGNNANISIVDPLGMWDCLT